MKKYLFFKCYLIPLTIFGVLNLVSCGKTQIQIAKNDEAALATKPLKVGDSSSVDGYRTDAIFNHPLGIAIDKLGNLYVSDTWNLTIRKITTDGNVSTFAGKFRAVQSVEKKSLQDESDNAIKINGHTLNKKLFDGKGLNAIFFAPKSIAVDSSSNLYVIEGSFVSSVRKITPDGVVTTYAGSPFIQKYVNGNREMARFGQLGGIAIDRQDNLYIVDSGNNAIRKIDQTGMVSTFAGIDPEAAKGTNTMDTWDDASIRDGPGTNARFVSPSSIAIDPHGNIYVTDAWDSAIRKISPEAEVSTFAGMPRSYGNQDGSGSSARFGRNLASMATDSRGNLYVADILNSAIRKITPQAEVSTFVSPPKPPSDKPGVMAGTRFLPSSIAVDKDDNLYVTDQGSNTIHKITSQGAMSNFAGKFMTRN